MTDWQREINVLGGNALRAKLVAMAKTMHTNEFTFFVSLRKMAEYENKARQFPVDIVDGFFTLCYT